MAIKSDKQVRLEAELAILKQKIDKERAKSKAKREKRKRADSRR